ncbi:Phosphofurin acidic cluster sorting protein 1 [Papilio xuthus]|uniref:Phosphofurin acidic cluster sorting protein 1 n=1 Tax=Papilio xuthus TaxID=66420 RepID=A0A194Q961_PAPXU|nr:Phosphofurin acidic cluster sorting protein 1 [Papilio xuthus]
MLQRRKKYKNRTILGYKTLAEGVIRMDQVLQRSMDMELELTGVGGSKCECMDGYIFNTLTANEFISIQEKGSERGYSDEEEEGEFSSVEEADEMTYGAPARRRPHRQIEFNKADMSYTKLSRSRDMSYAERERKRHSYARSKLHDRDSDSELESAAAKRKGSRGKLTQRNLKQKFAALLRRFRVPEELGERGAARDTHHAQRDIDELFQELESLSCGEGEDSGPDQMDTISIGSTPKPSLRPFFSSSRSLANQDHHRHSNGSKMVEFVVLPYCGFPHHSLVSFARNVCGACAVTRHASLASAAELTTPRDKLLATLPLTESEAMRSSAGDERGSEGNSDADAALDPPVSGASVSSSPPNDTKPRRTLVEQVGRVLGEEGPVPECVAVCGPAAALALQALAVPALVLAPPQVPDVRPLLQAIYARAVKQSSRRACVRVCVCGGEAAAAAALRAHAELAARRPHDAPNMRFYIVPIGACTVSRYLAASDSTYAALFAADTWPAICDRAAEHSMPDIAEMSSRIARYLNSGGAVNNVPIGEAMVACRDRAGEDDSSQTFVPFIAEVRVGCGEGGPSSLELEEGGSPPARPSPPATPAPDVTPVQPPLLPHLPHLLHTPNLPPQELQLDYWLVSIDNSHY